MPRYTDAEIDAFMEIADQADRDELARIDAYLTPRLRKLSLKDLRIVARAVGFVGGPDYHPSMTKPELIEALLEIYAYEICALMCKR